jgi:hypothetical protein
MELIAPGATWLATLIPENLSAITGADDKAKDGKDAKKADQSADKRRVIQDLMAPRPKSGDNKDPDGYSKKERQQMERLNEIVKDR